MSGNSRSQLSVPDTDLILKCQSDSLLKLITSTRNAWNVKAKLRKLPFNSLTFLVCDGSETLKSCSFGLHVCCFCCRLCLCGGFGESWSIASVWWWHSSREVMSQPITAAQLPLFSLQDGSGRGLMLLIAQWSSESVIWYMEEPLPLFWTACLCNLTSWPSEGC